MLVAISQINKNGGSVPTQNFNIVRESLRYYADIYRDEDTGHPLSTEIYIMQDYEQYVEVQESIIPHIPVAAVLNAQIAEDDDLLYYSLLSNSNIKEPAYDEEAKTSQLSRVLGGITGTTKSIIYFYRYVDTGDPTIKDFPLISNCRVFSCLIYGPDSQLEPVGISYVYVGDDVDDSTLNNVMLNLLRQSLPMIDHVEVEELQ